MTFADLSPIANHLWQSTLCVAAVWALTFALRKNRAAVRYWLWLAASVKFLIPFSLLVSAGAQLGWRTAPVIAQPQFSAVMEQIAQPFAAPALMPLPMRAAPALNPMPPILFAVWLCGVAIGGIFWLRWWWRIRAVRRAATPLPLDLPIKVMSSAARLEPGVFGILKPVLLLPEGIADRLTPPQLEAILAHELRHVQRRDNLTATIHMLVETIFWFHPLVWWIRARLVEERELACDEEVLRLGSEPQVYAEGILKVCEFYLASPVACVAGVTGGGLKKRIEGIMLNRFTRKLSFGKKILLASAAVVAIAGPIVVGLMDPPATRAQSWPSVSRGALPGGGLMAAQSLAQSAAAPTPRFEVASIKPADPSTGGRRGGMRISPGLLSVPAFTLRDLVASAYAVRGYQLTGGPDWFASAEFHVEAKPANSASREQLLLMLRSLLADRFKLALHTETRQLSVYALVVAKNGPKLRADPAPDKRGLRLVGLPALVDYLNLFAPRPVIDKTGLTWNSPFDLDTRAINAEAAADAEGGTPGMADTFQATLSALEDQLGLKLAATKAPVRVLVIDRAERPSAN